MPGLKMTSGLLDPLGDRPQVVNLMVGFIAGQERCKKIALPVDQPNLDRIRQEHERLGLLHMRHVHKLD